MIRHLLASLLALMAMLTALPAAAQDVRLKDLGRFAGWRENPLVGYGVVTGLAGTGDSPRSEVTRQALRNVFSRLGIVVTPDMIQSRNVAVVLVTASLPASANVGDRIDVSVTSAGDARSLSGGTLLMTPLLGPDQHNYALAQGTLVVGGYRYEADQNLRQRNSPTAGILPGGATVERPVEAELADANGMVTFLLRDPDISTAENVARGINARLGYGLASVRGADAVAIDTRNWKGPLNGFLAQVENVSVVPSSQARVVVNERSGTIVAGGDVRISEVTVAQGDIKVEVSIDNSATGANVYGGYVRSASGLVVTNTRLDVREDPAAVMHFPGASVADLAQGLARAKVPVRTMIAILQAMKTAGALHADIVVQ
ncbi:flagellar basal body P-ring protein FlgI [Novosphingobium sp. B 225]|uniref:flagellar basal body P-ring protein FlgI n=1 Tax=Novosphingobium sp. B 225 TaxID=1961849 RepID=UPI0020CE1D98|nr:flagellar basal body P-ring protein FlgI [Novosphingobium sp. B 225]